MNNHEERIHKIFSQIEVTDAGLADKVRTRMNAAAPRKFAKARAAIALAAILTLLAATVHATNYFFRDTADPGGRFEYAIVPDDCPEYRSQWIVTSVPIYMNRANNVPWDLRFRPDDAHVIYTPYVAHAVNALLDGKIFDASGEPFTLMISDGNGYRAADGDIALFDVYGREIGEIRMDAPYGDEWNVTGVIITTRADFEREWGYNLTREEAEAALGRSFRLPAEMQGFSPPRFRGHIFPERPETDWIFARFFSEAPYMGDLFLNIQLARDENDEPHTIFMQGEIMQLYAGETRVYKIMQITSWSEVSGYTWQHDGLVYQLGVPVHFYTNEPLLSEAETLRLIRDMLD